MIPPNTGNEKTPSRFRFHLLVLFIISLPIETLSLETCATYYCPGAATTSGDGTQPLEIRFPFIAAGSNLSRRCGYPGFNLTCSKQNHQPILTLPISGDFSVQSIDYARKLVLLSDPDNCLPKRILNLDLAGSPFSGSESRNNTFLNCTNANPTSSSPVMAAAVPCLSGANFTVYLPFMESGVEELVGSGGCRVMKSVWSPRLWPVYEDGPGLDLDRAEMALGWDVPDCAECERQGRSCGFSGGSGLDVNCSVSVSDSDSSNITRGE